MSEEISEVVENEDEYFSESYQETEDSEQEENQQEENQQEDVKTSEKTFTQSELDEIINKRLSREKSKFEQQQQTLKQQAIDEHIASLGHTTLDGKKITSKADYDNALEQQRKYEELVNNQGFSEDQARRISMAENKAENVQRQLDALMNKEKETQAIVEVMNWHDSMKAKGILTDDFDYSKIPDEVLASGAPLKEAYMEHVISNLKLSTQQETIKNIETKKQMSTGSTQGTAVNEDVAMTDEVIMKNASNPEWVKKNWEAIEKSGFLKRQ